MFVISVAPSESSFFEPDVDEGNSLDVAEVTSVNEPEVMTAPADKSNATTTSAFETQTSFDVPEVTTTKSTFETQTDFDEPEMEMNNKSAVMTDIRRRDNSSAAIKTVPVEKSVKVSTGCGPSPDAEIEEIFANESAKSFTPLREIPSRSSKVSIGTSPPPQSTSTQVWVKARSF